MSDSEYTTPVVVSLDTGTLGAVTTGSERLPQLATDQNGYPQMVPGNGLGVWQLGYDPASNSITVWVNGYVGGPASLVDGYLRLSGDQSNQFFDYNGQLAAAGFDIATDLKVDVGGTLQTLTTATGGDDGTTSDMTGSAWTTPTDVPSFKIYLDDGQGNVTAVGLGSTLAPDAYVPPVQPADDYLDLTGISGVYELDAEFGSWDGEDPDTGIVFVGDQYYEFRDIDGYVVQGLADSATTDIIRFNALDDVNETLILGDGYGLRINLGDGPGSATDVLVVDGGAITIDLSTADSNGFVGYTLTRDGTTVGSGEIRGADVILGSQLATDGDDITGADGADLIVGFAGDDTLSGGAGDDLIIGGIGSDTIDGGLGDDVIIDLDADQLTGGDGKDVFMVRGGASLADSATITDFEVSRDGLSFDGLDSQAFEDRIAFNFSASALSAVFSQILGRDITADNPAFQDPLSKKDYFDLANGLDVSIQNGAVGDPAFVLQVAYDSGDDGIDASDILGQVKFDVSGEFSSIDSQLQVFKAVLLEPEDLVANIKQSLLDQVMYESDSANNLPADDSVTLFVAVERQDKNAVFGDPTGSTPVLVAYSEGGVQIATKFRPGNADEVILGSRSSDIYALNEQTFIDPTTGDTAASQTFGNDTIVERDGEADILSMELRIEDLLVGDLTLTRVERGSEGDGRSLRVQYTDSTTDVDNPAQLNSVDTIIYKQYVDYDSSFRVEGLEMVDPVDGYSVLSLGETRSPTELAASGDTDAVLVGQTGSADTFTVVGGSTDTSTDVDLYISGFEAGDKIQFEGYEKVSLNILSTDPSNYADGFAEVTATNSASQGTVNFDVYFVNATTPIDDDFLFTQSTP